VGVGNRQVFVASEHLHFLKLLQLHYPLLLLQLLLFLLLSCFLFFLFYYLEVALIQMLFKLLLGVFEVDLLVQRGSD